MSCCLWIKLLPQCQLYASQCTKYWQFEDPRNSSCSQGNYPVPKLFITDILPNKHIKNLHIICQEFSSVTQSCPTPCDPMDYSMPGFPAHHQLPELAQTHVRWVGDSIHYLILCLSLLLLPSIFPRIRVFPKESVLRIRGPKCWSFSFSISPSNEYSGLLSFRIDWFDLLAIQETLKSLLQHHQGNAS